MGPTDRHACYLLVEDSLGAYPVPAELRVCSGRQETGQLPAALTGASRAEVEINIAKLQRVSVGQGDGELRGTRRGSRTGRRSRRSSVNDRQDPAIADQEDHGPDDGARNPDKPSTASTPPMRCHLIGTHGKWLTEGQCLIV